MKFTEVLVRFRKISNHNFFSKSMLKVSVYLVNVVIFKEDALTVP